MKEMLIDGPKLILHSHLEDIEILEVGWSSKYLTHDDKDKAQAVDCFEVRIDGLEDDDVCDEYARQDRERVAWRLSNGKLGKAYLVLVEHQSLPKNRIRSYKGLFPGKSQIKQGEYKEFEFELDEAWSFFVGMTPITKENKNECFAYMGDASQAFLLIASKETINVYTREFLESIIPCLTIKGFVRIDLFKLIPRICSQGLVIVLFGFDHHGDYVNIASFFNREIKEPMEQLISSAVKEVARYKGAYQIKPAPHAP